MTDETANPILEHGQAFCNALADLKSEVRANQRSTDAQLGLIRQQLTTMAGCRSVQDESRIERIGRRLDLVPGADA